MIVTELSALPNYYCPISLHNHNIAARRELRSWLSREFSDEILSYGGSIDRSPGQNLETRANDVSLASALGIFRKKSKVSIEDILRYQRDIKTRPAFTFLLFATAQVTKRGALCYRRVIVIANSPRQVSLPALFRRLN